MAIYKKTFKPNPPKVVLPPLPASPADNKRTFDARPKPSDDRRREERVRPSQHVDPIMSDPLDDAAEESTEE